ncbi:sphingosine-1-phosphate transporter SPNS2 isoform X1 [Melanerpes formicivorus]|uniref:sphingosine-1-phosphate transporter SPNS2 isoform X1 n=1 Tax=Dryobates pubescens TaxID=118200 RepID=UPI0023BA3645|nr:sphingosine-1-phosphate transporter SPNS2 isoform X1 [Dryobates pubescens]
MMCLESDGSSGSSPGCGGRLRAGDEEEEEDGERGCCGRGTEGEVQTLSGRMNPPATGKHSERPGARPKAPGLGRARVAAAGILSVGNVLNYLDRYTVAGVLLDIQQHFGVKDSGAGLLQTVFICSFMVAAPIFGYLGDRFNRKIILSCGIFFWSAVTFSSSFITEQYFWLLVLSRGLVGIGEASYSTIAPTIIGDLFTKNTRTLMLSVFYFAIPLGSGLGYITGSSVKQVAGDWHWALRVSPLLGMITGTLILIFVPAAKRGNAEQLGAQLKAQTSWLRDMKALIRNRSYVFSSLATSAVSFATGALGMWIPLYLHRAQVVQKTAETCSSQPCGTKDSLIFGAITCFTGFLGVITGAGATKWCRSKTQRADPLVCAVGMLGSAIFICLIFVAAKSSIVGAYICIFIGETLLFSNWAITADILMYVVIPTRRATAVALQSFTSHLLGDAGSPYLIGFISDLIRQSTKESPVWEFLSLGYALMLCPFVVVLGGMFFLATALFFLSDRAKAEHKETDSDHLTVGNYSNSEEAST